MMAHDPLAVGTLISKIMQLSGPQGAIYTGRARSPAICCPRNKPARCMICLLYIGSLSLFVSDDDEKTELVSNAVWPTMLLLLKEFGFMV
jgi:hypothetical protein